MLKVISILYSVAYIVLNFNFPFARLLALLCVGYLAVEVLKDVPDSEPKWKKEVKELTGIEYFK